MGRVLIAQATNLLVRGQATATPGRTASDGTPTHALYLVTRALTRALSFKTPDLAVAVVDPSAKELPSEVPLARLEELFTRHGLHVITSNTPNALVASYATSAREAGHDVVVVASDKRFAQLVGPRTWWLDAYKDVRYTPDLVRKRFEVVPDRVAEWLALVGDDDALPGIKGLGKKSATQLIERYESLAEALTCAEDVEGRVGKALRTAGDLVTTEIQRAVLDRRKALPRPLSDLAWEAPDDENLQALYAELGFVELLSAGLPEMEVVVCHEQEELDGALGELSSSPVALHAVTEDPSPVRGELVGLALVQDEKAIYVPLATKATALHAGSLSSLLGDPERPKIVHLYEGICVALMRGGIALAGVVADASAASHLHEPSGLAPHDLAVVAPKLLGRAVPDEDALRGVGRRRKPWSDLAPAKVGAHAAACARTTADVWEALSKTTEVALHAEYRALSETLAGMQYRGIGCDADDLEATGRDFARTMADLEAEIQSIAGKTFNVNSTKQLGAVLFEDLGLTVVKRTKTGWSTATDALERIVHEHPIVRLVIRYRTLRRLVDMWVSGLVQHIDPDGRVHCSMYASRSFSGRVICAHPDLGRVPGKTDEMARIRHAFRPTSGNLLLSVDYRQLGLYVLAHLSGDPALVDPLREGADMHRLTAAAVLERSVDDITPDERQLGKVVNFATFAGQGASALALELGVTAKEAKKLIARFDRRYAVTRAFQDQQLERVRDEGFITTIAGRRWPIGGLDAPDVMMRAYAERLARRATHEGSVADVSRRGLLRASEALRDAGMQAAPLLQVHDEVLFEVPEAELHEAARLAATAMRGAFDMQVPLQVGVEAGPNWSDLEPLELDSQFSA